MGIEPTVPLPGQQFSRLPDSATLAPLHVVDLTDGRRTYGVDLSLLRSIVRQLTLGSVIFQLIFFDAAQNRQDCAETHMISYGFRRVISRMVLRSRCLVSLVCSLGASDDVDVIRTKGSACIKSICEYSMGVRPVIQVGGRM